jgi:hypothetical protein
MRSRTRKGVLPQFSNARSACHSDEGAQRSRRNLQNDYLIDSTQEINPPKGIDQSLLRRFLALPLRGIASE